MIILHGLPLYRSKSLFFFSARVSPGDETSSVYGWSMISSTSRDPFNLSADSFTVADRDSRPPCLCKCAKSIAHPSDETQLREARGTHRAQSGPPDALFYPRSAGCPATAIPGARVAPSRGKAAGASRTRKRVPGSPCSLDRFLTGGRNLLPLKLKKRSGSSPLLREKV